jgi:hypothetical protein
MTGTCHISLESSQWGLKIFFGPHLNQRSIQEVMGFQSSRSPNFKNFGIPKLRVSGQNDTWVQTPWLGAKNTIRGKVVASPKSRPWWVLWVHVCPWFVRAPKMFKLHTNLLVVWFVQVRVSNEPACHSL